MRSLPRLSWTIGQTLLPEHMQGLEESLLSDAVLRSSASGLPCYGVADIAFKEALNSDGILTLDNGLFVMKSGRFLTVGGNATVNTLNLNTASETRLAVFVHLLPPEKDTINPRGQSANSSTVMPTWRWRLHLSFSEDVQGALEYLQFGVFEKNIRSEWALSESYIPPLLKLGSSVFLYGDLLELKEYLEKYTIKLKEELADIQLSGENLITAKRCMLDLRCFKSFVGNILGEIKPHPYIFFERLQQFYLEMANYKGCEPVHYGKPYQHDNLAGCLRELMQGTLDLLDQGRSVTPMTEFKESAGVMSLAMSEDCAIAERWFLLAQKTSLQSEINLEALKVCALPRLQILHKYFLGGIGLRKISRPIFQHYFGPEVDIYEMEKGEELSQALNDRSLAFLSESRFSSMRFFLYWSKV